LLAGSQNSPIGGAPAFFQLIFRPSSAKIFLRKQGAVRGRQLFREKSFFPSTALSIPKNAGSSK
jgi:hypothetical protein